VLYFFLSYAHGENDDLVAAFFEDLCAEVRTYTGDDQNEQVGFLDNDALRAGASWPTDVIDAVSTCRVFVALCSPRYFRSEPCGKEWAVFGWRLAAYTRATNHRAPALMPLLWVARDPPASLGDIQHSDKLFGLDYNRHGVRQLMRISTHRNAYLELVTALAKRICQIADEHDVPPLKTRPDWHAVPSTFHSPQAAADRASDDRAAAESVAGEAFCDPAGAAQDAAAEMPKQPTQETPPADLGWQPSGPRKRPILRYDTQETPEN
jgi:hypothetical protein